MDTTQEEILITVNEAENIFDHTRQITLSENGNLIFISIQLRGGYSAISIDNEGAQKIIDGLKLLMERNK